MPTSASTSSAATPGCARWSTHLTDEQIELLPRGGHDYRKVYAAFKAASEHVGQPTVILAHTVKGWTIDALEGKNATHQMKKLDTDALKQFRDRLHLPISDEAIDDAYEADGPRRSTTPARAATCSSTCATAAASSVGRCRAGSVAPSRSSCPATRSTPS